MALRILLLLATLSASFAGSAWSQEEQRERAARGVSAATAEYYKRKASIIRRLEVGIEALQEMGRQDEAFRLHQVLAEYKRPRPRREPQERPQPQREREREPQGERERERDAEHKRERPLTEREVALQQLETMRMAQPALLEAGRRDLAELLERAVRAREVALERRNDEEAREIREQAPTLGNQVELLGVASRLWREFGHADKARRVGALAEQLHGRLRRQREGERRERPDRERPERERPDRERPDRERPASTEIRELQQRVAELEAALREVRERLEQAQRDR